MDLAESYRRIVIQGSRSKSRPTQAMLYVLDVEVFGDGVEESLRRTGRDIRGK